MDVGREQYVVASRRAMIIHVVEPAYFKTGIVAERRACPLANELAVATHETPTGGFVLLAGICAFTLVGFAAFLTYALASFLGSL